MKLTELKEVAKKVAPYALANMSLVNHNINQIIFCVATETEKVPPGLEPLGEGKRVAWIEGDMPHMTWDRAGLEIVMGAFLKAIEDLECKEIHMVIAGSYISDPDNLEFRICFMFDGVQVEINSFEIWKELYSLHDAHSGNLNFEDQEVFGEKIRRKRIF